VSTSTDVTGTTAVKLPGRVPSKLVLLVASFGAFLAFLDATIVNVAFPSIRASFPEASISNLSWVLNSYNIIFAAFLIPLGRMADLIGRRRAFVWGVVIFTVASALCAVAPTVGLLVAARIVQALGAAMLVPASLALVVQAFDPEHRTHAVGLWGASAALASGLGPPIGGVLVELGGWRWAFLVNLPFGLAAFVAARRLLVESRAPGRRRLPDLRGATLLALALALLTLGIVQGSDWGWTSPSVLGSFAAAAVLLVGFVWSSLTHRSPLLDPALLRVRPFTVGNVATIFAGLGFYAYLLTNILWLTYVWRYSVLSAGLALVPGALVAAVVAAVLGPVAAARGYRRLIVPGALVWAGAYVWYATQVGVEPQFLTQWLPGQIISGIGVGMTLPLLGSAALAAVPGGRYATASAVVSSSRQIGGVLGIALLVVIIGTPTPATAVHDLRTGWWMSVSAFVVVAVASLFLGRIRPAAEDPVDPGSSRTELYLPPSAPPDGPVAVESLPLFRRLPDDVRTALHAAAVDRHVEAGHWLMREGDEAGSLFIVRTGRLEVISGDEVVRELGAGAVVGELALLTGGTRSASIRARRDSTVAEVSHADFLDAMGRDPSAYAALAAVLAEQLRDARPPAQPIGVRPRVVAVLGLHPGAPAAAVADELAGALAPVRAAVLPHATREAVEQAERDLERVVVTAAVEDEETWTFALRQADHVVLVARSAVGPGGVRVPDRAADDLVLVGSTPAHEAMADWCADLAPAQVTVVADNAVRGGLRSLAARIAGRAVGVVMAGGGARALAHIGVLQELEAAGLVVDRVSGCSMGSVVAGLYATGLDAAGVADVCYSEFVRRAPFSDYTVPTVSLARGHRARAAIERHLGGWTIEGLSRQFRAVSVDLLGRERVVHDSGPLSKAVMASLSLPVLFPPTRTEDRLLVDGGVLDNLPVDTLTARDEGPVLAVNITMGGGGGGGGSRRPGPPRTPGLGDTLLRTMVIGSAGAVASARARGVTVITPAPMGVGLLEFHQLDTVIESGRVAARELLAATGGTIPDVVPPAS
jgi:EmrB/QacA subfamily drug resistance transporter